ncbi:ImmA/IrrE family metallo-endopeptidase [Psychromarinibacter sp. C21-152]|uniref:ImmA/IrrE family metallo-endopeptidase n=1 Tax=Psychromarinibacter sediminicola TaxID=3033385 RepID=A0AAE3NXL8_9RHOB|nr:ImmA/IrrE family metallo-endopeptidase [Psychromarinibacter sediminicola]MDF0603971.1 ImmA/IrrE family metallo-endopeptidase [Psychromarinibacter sediminicola]
MLTYADKMEIVRQHQSGAPVQTVPLAKDLGVNVYHVPDWPGDLSGKIMKSEKHGGKSGYAIYVNQAHHSNRRRFTTAHEIAHFILHQDSIGDGITDDGLYRSRLSNAMEAQANRLAADILMPWHLLNKYIDGGTKSVDKLAGIFKVSESAMSIRLGVPA